MGYNKIKRYIFLLTAFIVSQLSYSQYVGEIGLLVGVSFYNGDANSTTPFLENNPAVGVLFKAKLNTRFDLKVYEI